MALLIAILFGIFALIGYGFSDYLGAIASRRLGASRLTLFSLAVSFTIMFVLFLLFFRLPRFTFDDVAVMAACGLAAVVGTVSYYRGYETGNVAIVTPIGSAWPVVTVFLGIMFLSQSLTYLEIAGVVIIIAGTIAASLELKKIRKLERKSSGLGWSILAMVGWGFCYFLSAVLVGMVGWFLATFFLVIFMILYLLPFYRPKKRELLTIRKALPICIAISLLELTIFLSYNFAVTQGNAVIVAPIAAASPVITVLLAFIFLKEEVEWTQAVGIIAIILGIIILAA